MALSPSRPQDGPMWCGELDRNGPAVSLFAGRSADGSSYERARILVREDAVPVAFVGVAVRDGLVDVDEAIRVAGPRPATVVGGVFGQPDSVSIVVCTRDRPELLRTCIEHVLRLDPAPRELVVVDNAPSDARTERLVRAYADAGQPVRYVCERRPGLSNARNAGLAAARGEVIAFTDDDVRVDRRWIHGLLAGFARRPDVACVTGLVAADRLDYPAERYFESRVSWSSSCVPKVFDLQREAVSLHPYAAGAFGTGANVAFRTSVLRDIGGFDEALGAGSHSKGGEDLDAFVRVLRHGHAIAYEPAALVWHRHRHEPRALRRQIFGYGTGLTAYLTKYLVRRATAADIARRVPRGLRHIRRAIGRTGAEVVPATTQPWLIVIELAGLLYGPVAYLRATRASRAGVAQRRRHRHRRPETVG